jgi:hypothetical protein
MTVALLRTSGRNDSCHRINSRECECASLRRTQGRHNSAHARTHCTQQHCKRQHKMPSYVTGCSCCFSRLPPLTAAQQPSAREAPLFTAMNSKVPATRTESASTGCSPGATTNSTGTCSTARRGTHTGAQQSELGASEHTILTVWCSLCHWVCGSCALHIGYKLLMRPMPHKHKMTI